MDKVFIFSASTGGGHNLAAKSIKEALNSEEIEASVYDAFKETNVIVDKIVTQGYKQMVEIVPQLYKQFYNQFNQMTPLQTWIFNTMARIINPDIIPMIQKGQPDLIISTHPFVTYILATLKENEAFNIPIISFVTDYKVHSVYVHKLVDAYIVGSEYTKKTLVDKGVPESIVYPYGIPIRSEFVKTTKDKNKLNEDVSIKATVLLMAGSLGTRQIERAFAALMRSDEKIKIIVVCGNSSKIERSIRFLNKIYKSDDKIVEIYGFVDNISELMDTADALVSKPGGLTTTEAIVKNIPMIIPYFYPGQEEENAEYLVESGMAIKIDKIKELTLMVDYLIENKGIIRQMSENMSEEARNYSIQNTVDLCRKLIEDSKM